MPLYEFCCNECESNFEVRRSFSDSLEDVPCPRCEQTNTRRVFTPTMVKTGNGGQSRMLGGGCSSCAATTCAGCATARR